MKIAVIGAGISGLSFAKYAGKKGIKVKVFEKNNLIGGIAKVKMVGNAPYHMIGGHCFNSKDKQVMDFVFNEVLDASKWNKVCRKATIMFKGKYIDYPIEFSMKQIFDEDNALAIQMIIDYMDATGESANNLEDWFINNFGRSLAENYFIPYNKKIWNCDPSEMSPDWVVDKLPLPNKVDFVKGLLSSSTDTMPHASFYYPKSGSQNDFINALAEGLDIVFNSNIATIKKNKHGKFKIIDEEFDHVIYTGALNEIHGLVEINDSNVINAIGKLKYNKVTTVLWRSKKTEDTWTYIPSDDILFHRLIHIGNFLEPKENFTISEAIGKVSYEDMVNSGKKVEQLIEPIGYNISDHAYVVFDKEINLNKKVIFDFFENSNVHLLGRFGEWEYYNMDICIQKAMQIVEKLILK